MSLPPKKLYTIAEVAQGFSTNENSIEDYLRSEKLQASIYLPSLPMIKFALYINMDCKIGDPAAFYNIDESDPNCYICQDGLFELFYKYIDWDDQGKAVLNERVMWLKSPFEYSYWGLEEARIISKSDVVVTLGECNRFADECGVDFIDSVTSNKALLDGANKHTQNTVELTNMTDVKLSGKFSEREKTFLRIICSLKRIIIGEFESVPEIHPSFKNQTEIINKLRELEYCGMSKRNLEGIFSKANDYYKHATLAKN